MARYVGEPELFFNVDGMEAFRTVDDTIIRKQNSKEAYLGETVNLYKGLDVEGIRLKRATTLILKSGGQLMKMSKDKGSLSRLKNILLEVMRHDDTKFSSGERSIYNGLLQPEGRSLLEGFDFNRSSEPGDVLGKHFDFQLKEGRLLLPDFSPELLLSKTTNVSSLSMRLHVSKVDFLLGEYITYMSKEFQMHAHEPVQDVTLDIGCFPEGDGFVFVYLWIGFMRDDAVAVPELLWHVDDVFRLLCCMEG